MSSDWAAFREVELFLLRDADLADSHRYEEWLALWTMDLRYWVPCNQDDVDPKRQISLIYDDRPALEERLYRLGTRYAHSQRPESRLSRVVSNIVFESYDPERGGAVTSRFVIGEERRERQTVWIGRARHLLVRDDGALRMKEKKIWLINNDSPMGNLTFIL
jgi:3-phenylpropionate/cinnamic acid dioxygenase small subunit